MPDVAGLGRRRRVPPSRRAIAESIQQVRRLHPGGLVGPAGYVNILAISGGGPTGRTGSACWPGGPSARAHPRPSFKIVSGHQHGRADRAVRLPRVRLRREDLPALHLDQHQGHSSKDEPVPGHGGPGIHRGQQAAGRDAREGDHAGTGWEGTWAQAHAQGRRLYISTTNLDALRQVVWDMGAIASHRTPESLALFRRVMLARPPSRSRSPRCGSRWKRGGKRYEGTARRRRDPGPGLPLTASRSTWTRPCGARA